MPVRKSGRTVLVDLTAVDWMELSLRDGTRLAVSRTWAAGLTCAY